VEKLISFYVRQFNQVMPHSAFHGQTPDEMFFGSGSAVRDELAAARKQARAARLHANRSLSCERYRAGLATEDPTEPIALENQEAA
jgi:hypothetical protein